MLIKMILAGIILMISTTIYSQTQQTNNTNVINKERIISGVVKNTEGEPLVGASVFWEGTSEGTTTDTCGVFSLRHHADCVSLIASYIGFNSDTIDISGYTGNQSIEFRLKDYQQSLNEVTVTSRRVGTSRISGAINGVRINREELFKAACCNLGESFMTNPSVDVNYSDAATGAKQIKLLGLSGTYVQMLTENLPNFRGAAAPYALDYVPGPWMNSILVSKGSSSVRNGYESITGQIDVEYLKPDNDQGIIVNFYGNTLSRFEDNVDANIHLNKQLSTELLLHYQDDYGHHDENEDGFLDQPNVQQWNLQNRWKWRGDRYIFHGGIGMVKEKRNGGQTHHTISDSLPLYTIGIETDRYEGYMKHAFILNPDQGTNIALMGNMSIHQTEAQYGHKQYNVDQKSA